MALSYIAALALLVTHARGHGRLTKPLSRKGDLGYENDPVPGYNSEAFVCRHAARNPNVQYTPVSAGGELTLQWDFGAAHVGDCAIYVSYEVDSDRTSQKYLKIANLPKCKDQNRQDVTITIPDFLPQGNAVLRWDWYALHVFPTVEFYSQCVDIQITSQSTVQVSQLETYSIISPPVYPANGGGGGYRNAFGNGEQFMTGPACAHGYAGNNCALTAVGTTGNTRGGGASLTGGGGGDSSGPTSTVGPTTTAGDVPSTTSGTTVSSTPLCEVYTVVAGDTLSAIAKTYTDQGKVVTWQQICTANGKTNCDVIDVGDNYVIPFEGSPCSAAGGASTTDETSSATTSGGWKHTYRWNTTDGTDGQIGAIGSASMASLSISAFFLLALCKTFS